MNRKYFMNRIDVTAVVCIRSNTSFDAEIALKFENKSTQRTIGKDYKTLDEAYEAANRVAQFYQSQLEDFVAGIFIDCNKTYPKAKA